MTTKTIAVVGGGAAGFFGAIAASSHPNGRVILIEKTKQPLAKVRISGGGRCNVTHACFDPAQLVLNYPRGSKELRSAFSRFQPRDTIQWFESRGVSLKTESDGRMFPTTDNSETIISCLMQQAKASHVELWTERGVNDCHYDKEQFILELSNGETLTCNCLLVASGNSPKVHGWLQKLGHTIIPPVPSLFTFNLPNSPLIELAGISIPKVKAKLVEASLEQIGPLLITHWGVSGPAILKLSAWGARFLHDKQYKATLKINWLPDLSESKILSSLDSWRKKHPGKQIATDSPVDLPKNLWKTLLNMANIPKDITWTSCSKVHMKAIVHNLHETSLQIDGKSTYKEEFVTCGGVSLKEVNFKTMESKICPSLYFAGEVLDIDGITGGFNFQNAWTTSWIAGQAIKGQ